MANQDPNDRILNVTPDTSPDEIRGRRGGGEMPNAADDRSTGEENEERVRKPGDSDSDAARGSDRSSNGEEFDREGRNPKPFSVS